MKPIERRTARLQDRATTTAHPTRASVHEVTAAVSGSPMARSRLGMPPCARIGNTPPFLTRYNVARRDGEAAATRPSRPPVRSPLDRIQRADGSWPVELAITTSPAPLTAGRAGLIEDHFADAQQRGHHADAESEAAREHEAANGMRRRATEGRA